MLLDLFCRVIDNYGDIGVCWRLARQLAGEHGWRVRLWVDDLHSLQPLLPKSDPERPLQHCAGVEIRHWPSDPAQHVDALTPEGVGDVVIEAFACELPAAFVSTLAARPRAAVWINLDYLTAESWAEDCHGLTSPHPALPLRKHFFFPGFSERSGGLLRERDLFARRDAEQAAHAAETVAVHGRPLDISLFCYDTAPIGAWLEEVATGTPCRLHVAAGKPLAAVRQALGKPADDPGPWTLGHAEIRPIPFLPQTGYDRLLWRCDLNFVRGEDSFVRAQWAARPLVWHIYAQEDGAHRVKLDAFLDRYTAGLDPAAAAALRRLHAAWNGDPWIPGLWHDYCRQRETLAAHARQWAGRLGQQDDLATRLVNFVAGKV